MEPEEDEDAYLDTKKYPTLRMKLQALPTANDPPGLFGLIAILLEDLPAIYLDSSGAALASYHRTHNG